MSEPSIDHRPHGKKHMNLRAVRLFRMALYPCATIMGNISKQTKDHANFFHPGFT